MFTGLIEEIGTVKSFEKKADGAILTVSCKEISDDIKIGDSIAIDGACQTVIEFDNNSLTVQTLGETLDLTILKNYKKSTAVNLERAMKIGSRFGGHIVAGHVEAIGKLINITSEKNSKTMYFQYPKGISNYLIYKGSIAINGISLTISNLEKEIFAVSVINHTFENTNLKNLKAGDNVNLETDMLAKYVEKFMLKSNHKELTTDFLRENGF